MDRMIRPIRSGAVLLVLAAGALVLTGCLPPINPLNRPTTIAGQRNGELPASQLTAVTASCQVYADAAESIERLVAAAWAEGVRIGLGSCYRDLAGQVAAREYWCGLGQCEMAAVPGTSQHGWGKAIDFSEKGVSLTFDSPGYTWMKNNAWKYGWNHPGWAEPGGTAPEPWHWEWVGDGGTMYPGYEYPLFP